MYEFGVIIQQTANQFGSFLSVMVHPGTDRDADQCAAAFAGAGRHDVNVLPVDWVAQFVAVK